MSLNYTPATKPMTADEAAMYVFCFRPDGQSNWRVPTAAEYFKNPHFTRCWLAEDFERTGTFKLPVILVKDEVRSPVCEIIQAPRSEQLLTYNDAKIYCFFLNHDGLGGWRLPTIAEYNDAGRFSKYGFQHNGWLLDASTEHNSNTLKYVYPVRTKMV